MQAAIEEGKEAQQAAKAHQGGQPRGKPADGRDGQRDDQQAQSGEASRVGHGSGGVGPQVIGKAVIHQDR